MAIKFTVQRIGDPSDKGPNGECGILLVGSEDGKGHGETVYCQLPGVHRHGKPCAAAALDAQSITVTPAVLDDQGAVVTPAVTQSPRQRIEAWFSGLAVKIAADEALKASVDPLPTRTVQRVVDGRSRSVVEADRDLA